MLRSCGAGGRGALLRLVTDASVISSISRQHAAVNHLSAGPRSFRSQQHGGPRGCPWVGRPSWGEHQRAFAPTHRWVGFA